jgi:hypothetical protein
MNEWLASLRLTDSLFLSYGRENLQWGPSWYISPSNPFFRENGRSNPKKEVAGKDFARLVWVPSMSWSLSLIANVGEGEQEVVFPQQFENTYALKVDYTGYRKYFSLIASYRDEDRGRLGGFLRWQLTDGLLLYTEAQVSEGTPALYPVDTGEIGPLGEPIINFEATKNDSSSVETIATFGASYTFDAGMTLTAEYLLNTPGYDDEQAELLSVYYATQFARALILPGDINQGRFDFINRELVLDPGLRALRRHYVLGQYSHGEIKGKLDLLFRYIYNLDDNSSLFIPIVQFDAWDNIELFVIGSVNYGDVDTEFYRFVDYSWFFGFEYTY